MAPEFRQYDEHGFPLPPRFDDLKYQDDEPPRRPKINIKTKRLVLIALVVCVIVPVIFGPQLITAGRELLTRWMISRAEHKLRIGDLPGALAELNRAIDFNPDDLDLHFLRAIWRSELNDLSGSLSDWNDLIDKLKDQDHVPRTQTHGRLIRQGVASFNRDDELAEAYDLRSGVLMRLGRGREAIDDASEAFKLRPTPNYLNSRAYARALANMELQEGLDDIEKALAQTSRQDAEYGTFLDTRGYLLHLLDRNEEALTDLNRAVEFNEQQKRRLLQQQFRFDFHSVEFKLKQMDRNLAVMYHHRGLVQEKLGHESQGEDDLRRGDQLGYDPANGVM